MARLLLRQEDAIKTLQLDTSFVMWLRLSLPGGAPEGMAVIQKRWREQQRLGQVTAPLRHVLWMNLWEELKRRLCPDAMTEEQQAEFIKMDFLSKSGEGSLSWPYLRWSAENKKLVPDSTRQPLTILEAHQTVTQLLQLSDPSQITRFHPTRPITSEMRGQTLTLLISVSNRGHNAQLLHGALIKLSNNACTQVLGMTYRPERLKRSPLATHIASMLEEMDPASRLFLPASLYSRTVDCALEDMGASLQVLDGGDGSSLFLPVLGTGVTFSRYQLRSCVVHLGDSTDSGHYRSALYDAHNSVFFYTNDGQSAVKATKAQQREISTNTYLLFYTLQ
ncbi:unnamed protein product [Symbiodinium necroappetens]|uniref:Peptidase C19 ubiquitin carboxyl-terminal hydrolase domain-containing protein n=1 Tax=Symbiodinium necroappetens TaxID=1628268 RepID=A0A812XD10_9DINO|nr:unnamed protein product [Symbiodinium necroappetens]